MIQGRVFHSADGRPLSGITVTDGRGITVTDDNGCYRLEGWERARVVSVGILTSAHDDWYKLLEDCSGDIDFCVSPVYSSGEGSRFLHISDSEIGEAGCQGDWVGFLAATAKEQKADFLIHTGDICRKAGLIRHRQDMNCTTVGVPVRYTLGNHDYVAEKYGEYTFEKYYGPTWYSFDLGGVHHVILPIKKGEAEGLYQQEDSNIWLAADLERLPENTPVAIFCHEILSEMKDFTLKAGDILIDLRKYGLKCWSFGHYHINHRYVRDGVEMLGVARPDVGGIDLSLAATRFTCVTSHTVSSRIIFNRTKTSTSPSPFIWRRELDAEVLFSAPVTDGEYVYVCTANDGTDVQNKVYCIRLSDGGIIWSFPTVGAVKTTPLILDSNLWVLDNVGNLYLLDRNDGTLIKQLAVPMGTLYCALVSPLCHGDRVYAGTTTTVAIIDAKTHEIIGQTKFSNKMLEVPTTYLISDGRLYIGTHWQKLTAFCPDTLEQLWSCADVIDNVASRSVIDGRLIAPSRFDLFALEPADGSVLAKVNYDPPIKFNTVAAPVGCDGEIYLSTSNRGVVALDSRDLSLIRSYPASSGCVAVGDYLTKDAMCACGTPLLLDGRLIFNATDGSIYVYEASTAKLISKLCVGAPALSAPLICSRGMITADISGNVTLFPFN